MNKTWNFQVSGLDYKLDVKGNKITITPGETYKISKLPKKGSYVESFYEIPIEGASVVLYLEVLGKACLTVNGFDVETGEEHIPMKMQGWAYIFLVLYTIDLIFIMGGFLGGALNFLMMGITGRIAANRKQKGVANFFICLAIYIATTIGELIIVTIIYSVLQ